MTAARAGDREGPAHRLGGAVAAGRADGRRLHRAAGRAAARSRSSARSVVPVLTLVTLGVTAGLGVWQWDDNAGDRRRRAGDRRPDAGADDDVRAPAAIAAVLLSWRSLAAAEAGEGEYYALLLIVDPRHGRARRGATNLVVLFIGFELLSIPLYVLCATQHAARALARVGPEVPDHRLGRLGDAAVRAGAALRRDGRDRLRRDRRRGRRDVADDVLFLTGIALVVAGLAFKASVAPFHQWTPDVYEGAPTPVTGVHGGGDQGGGVRRHAAALRRRADRRVDDLGAGVRDAGGDHDRRRQRRRDRAVVAEAACSPTRRSRRRATCSPASSSRRSSASQRDRLLPRRLPGHEPRRVRGDRGARARDRPRRRHLRRCTGSARDRPWLAWPMTIAMLALAGFPATAGFFGKIYLIEAAVDNGYAWLGVVDRARLGDLARRTTCAWSRRCGCARPPRRAAPRAGRAGAARPAIAGGSPEADEELVAPSQRHRRGLGHGRRGRLRDRDDRVRRLPRAAVQRRPRRGRGVEEPAVGRRFERQPRLGRGAREPPASGTNVVSTTDMGVEVTLVAAAVRTRLLSARR